MHAGAEVLPVWILGVEMKAGLAEKIAEFIVEEAKRLSFLLACVVCPLAVFVFGSLLFR